MRGSCTVVASTGPIGWLCLLLVSALLVSAALMMSGCDKSASGAPAQVKLNVFAASSLTDAFQEAEASFEKAHPHVDVALNFAGSQALRLQIEQGAKADVFASANQKHMAAIVDQKLAKNSEFFAHNELVIITPADASNVESVADLPAAKRLVIGADNVPVGMYTDKFLAKARAKLGDDYAQKVAGHVVSRESNVRLVRSKVALGEADAAVVYRTDAASSKKVRMVAIPEAMNVRADYPIAVMSGSAHPALARAFVDFLRSKQGRAILDKNGFVTDAP